MRLTAIERKVIDTPAFQRLRRVKQLGLACLAFPSADYPRFEHSLGVLEVTGRLLNTLARVTGNPLSDDDVQAYRLAALLHDIGHYPFSHAMDDAINDYYKDRLVVSEDPTESTGAPSMGLSHEKLGGLILKHDECLKKCLDKHNIDPGQIAGIFNREDPTRKLTNMASSDLDADRLDYLARTACHTGLPYGKADIDYLVEHVDRDQDGQLCFDEKALRSVEHMLLARYFDYQTLVRHRVVAGLEMLLKDILKEMLAQMVIGCTKPEMVQSIENGDWIHFDDLHLMQKIRRFQQDGSRDDLLKAKLRCVLDRVAPKTVAEAEWFGAVDEDRTLRKDESIVEARLDAWADTFDIPRSHWMIWKPTKPLEFTKADSVIKAADNEQEVKNSRRRYEQAARVKKPFSEESQAVVDMRRSLISVLASHRLYSFRVVVVPPLDRPLMDKATRSAINQRIHRDCPDILWK